MSNPTDYRALCAELLEAYEWCIDEYMTAPASEDTLVQRARAELAKPEPVGVTLANTEIQEWADSSWVVPLQEQGHDDDDWRICFTHEEFCDAIREALSRWGNPTIQPERDESVMDRLIAAPMDSRGYVDLRPGRAVSAQPEPVGVTDEDLLEEWYRLPGESKQDVATFARSVLTRYARPAIQPVPTSERLPLHITGELDDQGTCWNYHPSNLHYCLCVPDPSVHTHWLPHWALPIPTPANNTRGTH